MQSFFEQPAIRLSPASVITSRRKTTRIMHRASLIATNGILTLVLLFFPIGGGAKTTSNQFSGTGEIIVLSPVVMTIAAEVMLNGKPHIVGGQLAPDAVLLKGDKKKDLNAFEVGEIVRISWRTVGQRKEIVTLISTDTSPASPELPVPKVQKKAVDTMKSSDVSGKALRMSVAPLLGSPQHHIVGPKETLLDIARLYNLGYNEIIDMYPDYDPWLPPVGKRLLLPTERLLPDSANRGIVINVPEMRLYHFTGKGDNAQVVTHPVGIGDTDFQTEPGSYTVGNKAINPTWYIPPSLRAKYAVKSIPPGPDNPLGKYWLGLKGTNYGIHGSDIPWSIGRKVTHGCIRMYPEDISVFFTTIQVGTPVEIVYDPVKIARIGDEIYIEVHRDIYAKYPDLAAYAREKLVEKGYWMDVDRNRLLEAVEKSRGIPENITYGFRLTAITDQRQ